jgi:hypothetical protein
VSDRWARRLPTVDVPVDCGVDRHLVRFRRGSIVLVDHSMTAEAAAVALGAPTNACFEVYRSWRSREQWEIALQPRGPGFHQLYRRPPLPKPLLEPLERGIARGWERRAARGEGLAGYVLQRAVRAKAEPSLESSFSHAVRRRDGGPIQRLELAIGPTPEARGTIDPNGSWLTVRVTPDWLRTIGLARRAVVEREFVVSLSPVRLVVGWRADGPLGTWRAELVERP